MSYEVTATRRRPQHFDDLIGQEFVAETLKNSIKSGKIAHAYLFAGPRGCGKTSTARILAKALNCQNGPTDMPCGQCSNCEEITKGTSLDVIEIDGASNTSVENIRQIKDEVLFPPSNSKYKIYIIDEVHMLSTSAFNALLKTIEEPPPYVIFIFATTELQKVPATIKSRCQQFNFRLVAIDKVKQCLSEAAAELGIQAEDEALYWIARESTGSMRDAYTLFDQVVAFSDSHITYEKIRDKLGLVGVDRLNTIFEACAQNKPDVVMELLDKFLQGGVSIEQLISNCADYLRSLLLLKNNVRKESLLGNSPERYSSIVLGAWNTVQVERALSIFFQLYRDIRYSLSPRYEMELTFSRLCWIGQYVSSSEVKKAIDAAQALLTGAPVNTSLNVKPADFHQDVKKISDITKKTDESYPEPATPAKEESLNIPKGLPRLSMLDSMADSTSDSAADLDNNPFKDGGPIPPEKQVETKDNPVIDERLKINIPMMNIVNDNVIPTAEFSPVEVPVSENGYTENPDDIDGDGWSNIDEPPEDDYYPDTETLEEEASQLEQSFDNNKTIEEEKFSGDFVSPKQMQNKQEQESSFIELADGSKLSIDDFKIKVISELKLKDSFAAPIFEQTGSWSYSQDAIETTVENAYDLELIKNKIPNIVELISTICGRRTYFNVVLRESTTKISETPKKLPPQVNMLLDVFKGTLIAGK